MVVQLRRMAFTNKNIAPVGWTLAPFISISRVGTPLFISFLWFTYIELQMDKILPKSKCRFYLDGMTLTSEEGYVGRRGGGGVSNFVSRLRQNTEYISP